MSAHDGMLVGKGDGSGALMRVFDPPWWRVDRWLGWFFVVAFDAVARSSRPRGLVTLPGGKVVRAVEDGSSLANVPRRRR